jgi:Holliday junction resolvasome RuvABC endonuclease subunit
MIVGVDINTKYLAVARIDGGRYVGHWIIPAEETKRASALDRLYAINEGWRFWLDPCDLECVYVEDVPFVRNVKVCAQMNHVLAAVILGCHDAGVPVVLVGNTTWKKAVVGSGKADKAIIKEWAMKVLKVPGGLVQDVYDAACVCQYGQSGMPK